MPSRGRRFHRLFLALVLSACDSPSATPEDAHVPIDAAPIDAGMLEPSAIGMTDVTILWPLPDGPSADPLLRVDAIGRGGALVPAAVLAMVPPLDRGAPNDAASLRVVAMRLDPCFPGIDLTGPIACRRQIRLVAQPLRVPPGAGSIAAADAAIHLLYDVDAPTFETALARIIGASRAAGVDRDAPLAIHPALASEGLEGTFATELHAVIVASVGAENLVRVTSTTRESSRAPSWQFASVDVAGGVATPTTLVALREAAPFQTLSMMATGEYETSPEGASPDDPSLLFDLDAAAAADDATRRAAWTAALRIEHPERHSPETVDCAGCHVAPQLRRDAEARFALAAEPSDDRFVAAGLSLAPPYATTEGARERIRALGYFEREPLVSQRVMNETALVVLALRAAP